jgi:hypothetical protein
MAFQTACIVSFFVMTGLAVLILNYQTAVCFCINCIVVVTLVALQSLPWGMGLMPKNLSLIDGTIRHIIYMTSLNTRTSKILGFI